MHSAQKRQHPKPQTARTGRAIETPSNGLGGLQLAESGCPQLGYAGGEGADGGGSGGDGGGDGRGDDGGGAGGAGGEGGGSGGAGGAGGGPGGDGGDGERVHLHRQD